MDSYIKLDQYIYIYEIGLIEIGIIKYIDFYIFLEAVMNQKPNQIYDFLKTQNLKVYWLGDLYQKISKKDKVNNEYYITNVEV